MGIAGYSNTHVKTTEGQDRVYYLYIILNIATFSPCLFERCSMILSISGVCHLFHFSFVWVTPDLNHFLNCIKPHPLLSLDPKLLLFSPLEHDCNVFLSHLQTKRLLKEVFWIRWKNHLCTTKKLKRQLIIDHRFCSQSMDFSF